MKVAALYEGRGRLSSRQATPTLPRLQTILLEWPAQ